MSSVAKIDIKELGYLVYGSARIDRWALFADQVMGAMVVPTDQGGLNIRTDERAARILFQPATKEELLGVGWLVSNDATYASAMAFAKQHDIFEREGSASECRDRHICAFFAIRDPNGVTHEIAWGPQVDYATPFRSSLGSVQFLTGEQGLGHIVLGTEPARFDETMDFWVSKLGFSLSNVRRNALNPEKTIFRLQFYGCANGRQHTIAAANLASSHACQHIMLQYPTIDDMGRAYDRVEKNGFRHVTTIGRHINDQMVSFYVESPSGFWVELGYSTATFHGEQLAIDDGGTGSIWGHKHLPRPT